MIKLLILKIRSFTPSTLNERETLIRQSFLSEWTTEVKEKMRKSDSVGLRVGEGTSSNVTGTTGIGHLR